MNLIAYAVANPNTADFSLLFSAVDDNYKPVATVASVNIDDPNLKQRLQDICQAYRMGARHGKGHDL